MAARDTGPIRFRLNGDGAQAYVGMARKQMGILKELMAFGNLPQLTRTVTLPDGTTIHCQSIFGQDMIRIDAPVAAVEAVEAAEVSAAVNRVVDYVGVAMPNPVPYRGLSFTVVPTYPPIPSGGVGTAGVNTIALSDGTILASENFNIDESNFSDMKYRFAEASSLAVGPGYAGPFVWNGGGKLWMIALDNMPSSGGYSFAFDHFITFNIAEDCVYPAPPANPPPNNFSPKAYYGDLSLTAQWNSDWAAGVAAFNARRKAWFMKNSAEFIVALKGKFQPGTAGVTRAELQTGTLPASWDYQIKSQIQKNYNSFVLHDGSLAGHHTKMPIVMSITSAADVVVSDTSANLTQAGTKVTKRTTTFAYTDANGRAWSVPIDGTLTQVCTQHTLNGSNVTVSHQDTYLNWYVPTTAPANETLLMHQFLLDRAAYGVGLLWNGMIQQGYNATSAYGAPGNPLTYAGYAPAYPTYSNTLVGTAPAIFLQYHNTVLPQYVSDTTQSSTVMNNSAMYHVKQVELCLFGPAPGGQAIGIFPDPTDADGATQIAYYGEASFSFDWTQGKLTMLNWVARKDANGNDAPTIIAMPSGYSYKNVSGTLYFNNGVSNYTQAYNCAVGYAWDSPDQMWPDVAEYLRAKIAQMLAGGGDQVLYTIIKQALAL